MRRNLSWEPPGASAVAGSRLSRDYGPRGCPRGPQGPLQRCLSRPVRLPERFRGCCPFGARRLRAGSLPAGVISRGNSTSSAGGREGSGSGGAYLAGPCRPRSASASRAGERRSGPRLGSAFPGLGALAATGDAASHTGARIRRPGGTGCPPSSGGRTQGSGWWDSGRPAAGPRVPFADLRSVMKTCQPSSSTRAWIRDTTPAGVVDPQRPGTALGDRAVQGGLAAYRVIGVELAHGAVAEEEHPERRARALLPAPWPAGRCRSQDGAGSAHHGSLKCPFLQ